MKAMRSPALKKLVNLDVVSSNVLIMASGLYGHVHVKCISVSSEMVFCEAALGKFEVALLQQFKMFTISAFASLGQMN